MKKQYQAPYFQLLTVNSADVITASKAYLGDDNVIEMKEYEFEGA